MKFILAMLLGTIAASTLHAKSGSDYDDWEDDYYYEPSAEDLALWQAEYIVWEVEAQANLTMDGKVNYHELDTGINNYLASERAFADELRGHFNSCLSHHQNKTDATEAALDEWLTVDEVAECILAYYSQGPPAALAKAKAMTKAKNHPRRGGLAKTKRGGQRGRVGGDSLVKRALSKIRKH